jgi:hypothetical protein
MAKISAFKGENTKGIDQATEARTIFESNFDEEHPHYKNAQAIINGLTERVKQEN